MSNQLSGGAAGALPPLFRWAGSKKQLLGTLAAYWSDDCTRYVEPFAGSACLYFRLRPQKAVLGDLNKELVRCYVAVRDSPSQVSFELARFTKGASQYYRLRSTAPDTLASPARAARFIYLNRYCFNGLYRTNGDGAFNVPYGGDKSGSLPDAADLEVYAKAIEAVEFRSDDFALTLADVTDGDFVYLDPPYAVKAEWRRGLHYTNDAFATNDVDRLQGVLRKLDATGATFVLSYADSDEGHQLGRPYYCRTVEVRRSIAGSVFKRVKRSELLISNRPHPAGNNAS